MQTPPGAVLLDENFGGTVINATDIPNETVFAAMSDADQAMVRTLEDWVNATQPRLHAEEAIGGYGGPGARRQGGIFMRDRYITPAKPFDQMRLAYEAVNTDDIVAGVAESTESLAFSTMDVFALDEDEQDVYNQICAQIDLDSRMREIWRDLFTVSQAYVAVWWKTQTFKVRGRSQAGNERRKEFTCFAPSELSLIDPLRVVPVGSTLFGKEQLAYIATPNESTRFDQIMGPDRTGSDAIVERLVTTRYTPSREEDVELQALGVGSTKDLWLLNPKNVWRHTVTRPAYQRLATVRMQSVFELLDMKAQLRQMERAYLLGNTNFILVVTKGTDTHPALPKELANLQGVVRSLARVPVLIGDHRVHVEIVTPKLDNTLRAERWNAIDARISGRLYQLLVLGNYSAGASGDDSIKLVKVIARGMESRRHMIRRSLERNIFKPLYDRNEDFKTQAKLRFHPRSIALDFDANYASFLFDLRQANDLSRETILNQFDMDEAYEAELRKREKVKYDDIFQTQVPFSTPNPANPANPAPPVDPNSPGNQNGEPSPARRDNGGGRRNGGGAAPGSGQGQPARRARRPAASEERRPDVPISDGDHEGADHADPDDAT